ncbi:MAG: MFS transporter [Candidatus Bathyarchaeia archaeon]
MVEYWKKAAAIRALGGFSDTMDLFVATATYPMIGKYFGWTVATIGYVQGLTRIGTIVHALISGPLIDFVGRKWIWTFANLGTGITCFFLVYTATTPEAWILIGAFRLLFTWMSGAAGIFLQEEAPPDKRAFVSAVAGVLSTVGAMSVGIGMTICGIMGWDWRALWLFNGIQNIFTTIVSAIWLKESTLWLQRKKLIEEGKLPKSERLPLKKLFSPELRKIVLIFCWMNFWLAFARSPHWFRTTYLMYDLKVDVATVGSVLTVAEGCSAITNIIFGRLADKWGRLPVLRLTGGSFIVSILMCFLTHLIVGPAGALTMIWVSAWFVLYTIFNAAYAIPAMNWMIEMVPTSLRASIQTLTYLLYSVEIVLATWIGLLAGTIGTGLAVAICGSLGVLFYILPPLILRVETKGKVLTTD